MSRDITLARTSSYTRLPCVNAGGVTSLLLLSRSRHQGYSFSRARSSVVFNIHWGRARCLSPARLLNKNRASARSTRIPVGQGEGKGEKVYNMWRDGASRHTPDILPLRRRLPVQYTRVRVHTRPLKSCIMSHMRKCLREKIRINKSVERALYWSGGERQPFTTTDDDEDDDDDDDKPDCSPNFHRHVGRRRGCRTPPLSAAPIHHQPSPDRHRRRGSRFIILQPRPFSLASAYARTGRAIPTGRIQFGAGQYLRLRLHRARRCHLGGVKARCGAS